MIAEPLTWDGAQWAKDWRNECRESLRTGGWTTEAGQRDWLDGINRPKSDIWYWEFYEDGVLLGVGGLVGIDRWNGSAELSVLVCPSLRARGYGRRIVHWLIAEGCDTFRLNKVWAEVYDSNPAADAWPKILAPWAHDGRIHVSKRPAQKYWDGQYWDSTVYDILE